MMSDDSFIREVNEEIRQDQAKALWDRYGPAFIGLAIVVVLVTAALSAGSTGPKPRPTSRATTFSAALLLANDGKNDEALAALDALEKDGYGAYPLLARMRAATVLFDKGDFTGAVAGLRRGRRRQFDPRGDPRHGAAAGRADPRRQGLLRRRLVSAPSR